MDFPRLEGDLSRVTHAPRLSIGGYVNTLGKARGNRQDFISAGRHFCFLKQTEWASLLWEYYACYQRGSYRSGGI